MGLTATTDQLRDESERLGRTITLHRFATYAIRLTLFLSKYIKLYSF